MTRQQFELAMTATGDEDHRHSCRFYLNGDASGFFEGTADKNDGLAEALLVRVNQNSMLPVVLDITQIAAIERGPCQ